MHRPEPILRPHATPIDSGVSPRRAAERLRDGESLQVTDSLQTGLGILEKLRRVLPAPADEADFATRRAHRRLFTEASERLLAPIKEHQTTLTGAPGNGFLRQLYPELKAFSLPFPQLQQLNNAWQWYRTGVHLAVLGHALHPYYGTYAPSRVDHLELFATWLSQFKGPRTRAIDVGTGSGVLAFMLCKAGFESVLATDINPNAIESVKRELQRHTPPPPIDLLRADLFGDDPRPADLIVFNPPWTKGVVEGPLDRALYFEDGLFERFFTQAHARLSPEGRVVLVFSNVIQLVQADVPHPIEAELERGRFTLVQKQSRRARPSPSKSGRRRRTRERVEVWELQAAP